MQGTERRRGSDQTRPGAQPGEVRPEDLLALRPALAALAFRMSQDVEALSSWEPEDLVQEALLRALTKLDKFHGRSSLKTWVITVAKRHLLTMARAAAIRPRPGGDAVLQVGAVDQDDDRREDLKESTGDLLGWLDSNPDEVKLGWEVLNLLLWNHGNYSYVALALSIHTGTGWSEQRVRAVVRRIKETPHGRALCAALLD